MKKICKIFIDNKPFEFEVEGDFFGEIRYYFIHRKIMFCLKCLGKMRVLIPLKHLKIRNF